MGRDKAMLPFGPELMLQRVVRLAGVAAGVECITVVAGKRQPLPELPPGVVVVRDEDDHLGPLSGLAVGLRAIAGRVDAVFVTGCDVPLLAPAFVERLFELLGAGDAIAPSDADGVHPLAAVYRVSVVERVGSLLAAGERRPRMLLDALDACKVNVDDLRQADPQLGSLQNVNTPESYAAALAAAGLSTPPGLEAPPTQRETHAS